MSIWSKYKSDITFPSLQENKIVDTLIIGGGMTGLNSLYFLKDQENVCLVEANEIGQGVSMNTTGKINYLQDNTFVLSLQKGKTVLAQEQLASQIYGMKLLLDIITKEQIDCDLEAVTSYLVTNQESNIKVLKRVEHFLQEHHIEVTKLDRKLSFLYGIGVKDTFVFHPIKYMIGLCKALKKRNIYEHTKILKIVAGENCYYCHTKDYCIRAKKVILACHYPFFLFPFLLPMRSSVEKSYLIAHRVKENEKYTYITLESPSQSVRFYQNGEDIYRICLGESHDISTKQNDEDHFKKVQRLFSIDESSIECVWSNVDLTTMDGRAYVGEIKPNLYLATGYQTWGMIQSALSGKILSDFVNNQVNEYQHLFYPKRKSIDVYSQILVSGFKNTKSFLSSKYYPKSWYSNSLTFHFQHGKFIATYNDEQGSHCVHPVCPHMKCSLIFNEVEKTWDCPCHSSRFDLDGQVIKGPSNYSIACNVKKTKTIHD